MLYKIVNIVNFVYYRIIRVWSKLPMSILSFRFIGIVHDTNKFLCNNTICLCPQLKTPQNINYKQDIFQISFLYITDSLLYT